MWNGVEIIYDFLELYKKLIIENILQPEKIWPWKVEGVGFIETFKVCSGEHISHKYTFVSIYDIKRIKCH